MRRAEVAAYSRSGKYLGHYPEHVVQHVIDSTERELRTVQALAEKVGTEMVGGIRLLKGWFPFPYTNFELEAFLSESFLDLKE